MKQFNSKQIISLIKDNKEVSFQLTFLRKAYNILSEKVQDQKKTRYMSLIYNKEYKLLQYCIAKTWENINNNGKLYVTT